MESIRIEQLLEKYFQGETGLTEEKELKAYFSSSNVAQHLEQYKPLFAYYNQAATERFEKQLPFPAKSRFSTLKLAVAAAVILSVGIITTKWINVESPKPAGEYGTYNDPKVALEETKKALALVSEKLNVGVESVEYIDEYQTTKNKIFIDQ